MLIECQSETDWVTAIENQLAPFSGTGAKIFLPAGETPKPLFRYWRTTRPQSITKFKFFQIDEILDGQRRFEKFFTDELPDFSVAKVEDFDLEADVAILGLGVNGHVGFHEPHIDPKMVSSCVRLSGDSCQRLQLKAGTWGLTYGIGAFQRCRKILLLVRGPTKQPILQKVLAQDLNYPASYLVSHPGFVAINLR